MIKDKEGNHMEEIEEVLSKDSRYHVLEVLSDDRADLLMAYLEELERAGPPDTGQNNLGWVAMLN